MPFLESVSLKKRKRKAATTNLQPLNLSVCILYNGQRCGPSGKRIMLPGLTVAHVSGESGMYMYDSRPFGSKRQPLPWWTYHCLFPCTEFGWGIIHLRNYNVLSCGFETNDGSHFMKLRALNNAYCLGENVSSSNTSVDFKTEKRRRKSQLTILQSISPEQQFNHVVMRSLCVQCITQPVRATATGLCKSFPWNHEWNPSDRKQQRQTVISMSLHTVPGRLQTSKWARTVWRYTPQKLST